MKCDMCGNENKDGAKFCKFCGKTVVAQPSAPAPDLPLSPMSQLPEFGKDFNPVTRTIEETGEVLELVDREAEQENLHVLSSTFADTLTQLARSREELANVEERIADALKMQRDREESKLREIQANYELTQKKIQALEELSLLRKLREGEDKLAAIFRGESVDIGSSILSGIGEDDGEELEELEDLDEIEDLEELEDLDGMDENDEAECPECGTTVSMDAKNCPSCGVDFE